MEEAGKRWGVSTTIIKRVCRKFGIERWPYRQIQSAQKKIAALEDMLRTRTRTSAEQEKVKVCPGSILSIIIVRMDVQHDLFAVHIGFYIL